MASERHERACKKVCVSLRLAVDIGMVCLQSWLVGGWAEGLKG
jgi:hypothetical protein